MHIDDELSMVLLGVAGCCLVLQGVAWCCMSTDCLTSGTPGVDHAH